MITNVDGGGHPGTACGDLFWGFSLAFYERPGVAAALLALQDNAELDVNLILFALWCGLSGRGLLDGKTFAAAAASTAGVRADVVVPLRRIRRRLKQERGEDLRSLRAGIQKIELAAEKIVQYRLAAVAASPQDKTHEERLSDAIANLGRVIGDDVRTVDSTTMLYEAVAAFGRD